MGGINILDREFKYLAYIKGMCLEIDDNFWLDGLGIILIYPDILEIRTYDSNSWPAEVCMSIFWLLWTACILTPATKQVAYLFFFIFCN